MCKHSKRFRRYVNSQTGELYPDANVGKCDRVQNCGYWLKPSKNPSLEYGEVKPRPIQRFSNHSKQDLIESLGSLDKNYLYQFLDSKLNKEKLKKTAMEYYLGTHQFWKGSAVFWQVDTQGLIRGGKVIAYDPNTGKRTKDANGKGFTHWIHSIQRNKNFELKQCFFGEHLLVKYPLKDVRIVESEKTALIAYTKYPEFIWLASGGLGGLNKEKSKVLLNRRVMLYPDLGKAVGKNPTPFEQWAKFGKEMGFNVSNILEDWGTDRDREQGLDLGDYWLGK